MHTRKGQIRFTLSIVLALAAVALAACSPAAAPTVPTIEPAIPVEPTQAAVQPAGGEIAVDLAGVAQTLSVETVPAVPVDPASPAWIIMPEYRKLALQGYPVTNHSLQAVISVYPLTGLVEVNQAAGAEVEKLQSLLTSRQPVAELPFLPLNQSKQAMNTQVQFLDFKGGSGVRYLTQYNQGPVKINNHQLFYTFQGLTSDGRYYIAAVLPVTHPDLPAGEEVFSDDPAKISGYMDYVNLTTEMLGQQPASVFTPELNRLDALVQSLEVK